ncbi:hypothetical protein BKA58DRAFT_394429 [Alternaria rosae]|uniref:uncharacterized protein n=1 Tax=Alternaria rosae TaxID=1187941 RepID=UPI001E8EC046|nr:uncharacterized protein BKA58DRAFT_394429 [Alternaria rosae]KAH6852884.1 hypothetical protein BKA58DRAFT_394429 [Alternaria rosae]
MSPTTSQQSITPPKTPDEFLAMIIKLDEERKSQHLPSHTTEQICTHSCGSIITSEGGPGATGNRQRTPLRSERHHALRLADETQRSVRLGKDGFSLEQQEVYNACHCEEILDSFETNVKQSRGHGHAWQRTANSIERAAPGILGYSLDLTRSVSLTNMLAWKNLKHWPSQKEVESWQLVYRVYGRNEEEEDDNSSVLSAPPRSSLEMPKPVDRVSGEESVEK